MEEDGIYVLKNFISLLLLGLLLILGFYLALAGDKLRGGKIPPLFPINCYLFCIYLFYNLFNYIFTSYNKLTISIL